jgi:hypothetical protein
MKMQIKIKVTTSFSTKEIKIKSKLVFEFVSSISKEEKFLFVFKIALQNVF